MSASAAIFAPVTTPDAIVNAPVFEIVASPLIATDVATFVPDPTRMFADVNAASFEYAIAAVADTLESVTALAAIVNAPVFEIVASPLIATAVGTLATDPTIMLADAKSAN